MTGTYHDNICTYMKISRSVLLRMRNVSHTSCRENKKTAPFIIWKSTAKPEMPQMTLHCGDSELDWMFWWIPLGGGSTKHPYPLHDNFPIHAI